MGYVSLADRVEDRPHPSAAARLLPSPEEEGLKNQLAICFMHKFRISEAPSERKAGKER